jgi:hypothetical protein
MPKPKAPELIRFGKNVHARRRAQESAILFLQFTDTVMDKSACVKACAVEMHATLRVQFIRDGDWYFICTNEEGNYETPKGTFRDLYVRPEQTTAYPCPRMSVKSVIAHHRLLVAC